jgi:CheY-like chemotaxis protein
MNFPIELYVQGMKRPAVLEDLSRTGMFVRVDHEIASNDISIGAIVHASMTPIPGRPRVFTAGTVVRAVPRIADAAIAPEETRMTRTAGVGVAFRAPINARDEEFGRVVAEMLDRHVRIVPPLRHRIVVAESHPHTAERLSILLDRAGFSVALATSGVEALSACHRTRPEVVLLDAALPLIDGFGVLRELPGTPAIVGSDDPSDRARASALGAPDFLPRPYQIDELITRAHRLARPRVVLRGSLADVTMPVLLGMLDQARKSGRLVLVRDGERGSIDLCDGRITGAEHRLLPWRRALATLLDWAEGTFELEARPPRPSRHALAVTQALLEHACAHDEARRAPRSIEARRVG